MLMVVGGSPLERDSPKSTSTSDRPSPTSSEQIVGSFPRSRHGSNHKDGDVQHTSTNAANYESGSSQHSHGRSGSNNNGSDSNSSSGVFQTQQRPVSMGVRAGTNDQRERQLKKIIDDAGPELLYGTRS